MNLEKNLIDNILETEIKLGHADMAITFYYPVISLLELLDCTEQQLDAAIGSFQEAVKETLGPVKIQELANEKGRFSVRVSAKGVNWVHSNFHPTEFMKQFVAEIQKSGITLGDIVTLFHSFSQDVEVKKVSEEEWSVSFADEAVDPYVYHIEKNFFGLEYHRFTKEAYRKTMEG
ncbi:MAG: DUF3877 family protein [Lachnospiraceae bacterium]|nr:DUF3877 family protein [Lachnospiraceae bacterium]